MAQKALTGERLNRIIDEARKKFHTLSPEKQYSLDKAMDIEFDEHFKFQQLQAEFHVMELLTTDAAQIVYAALGEVGSPRNGGWAAKTDTATKCIVTQLMGEMLEMSVKRMQNANGRAKNRAIRRL